MPRNDIAVLRQGLRSMLEATSRQLGPLDAESVTAVVDGLNRLATFARERSSADAVADDLWAELRDPVWKQLPARAGLDFMLLRELIEDDNYQDLIPALYDQWLELLLQLDLELGDAAVIELRLMLEELPSLWARWSADASGARWRLSRGLHQIADSLAKQTETDGNGQSQLLSETPRGKPRVWEVASAQMIALCDSSDGTANAAAFSDALRALCRLYVQLGVYVEHFAG